MKPLHTMRVQVALALGLLLLAATSEGQSNYASHGNSIEFEAPSEENNFGLPQQTILDGKVTKLDDLSPVIFLNRTKGALNCAAGIMQVELKFDVPFFGIAYADFDRNSACSVHGNGSLNFRLDLPLKGCGTVQSPQRVFTNNVVVRFHPGLEMDGDEVITVVCRYPPPVAPPPVGLLPRIELPPEAGAVEPPLKGFHILLIVCAILFLTLLLIGLGCSYYCLRHRKAPLMLLPPVSRPASSLKGTPLFPSSAASTASSQSDATNQLSSGTISMFEGLKIPRAHAGSSPPALAPAPLASTASDTLPSDYPSESLSSEEEMEVDSGGRMLLVTTADVKGIDRRPSTLSSAGSFENAGYQREEETFTAAVVPPPAPKFDVSVRVKRAPPSPPPPPSSATSDTTSICSSMVATRQTDRNNLDTIMEESHVARSMPPPMPLLQPSPPAPPTTFTYVPELHPQPSTSQHKMSERQQQMAQYSYRQKREWTDVEAARSMNDESDTILRGVDIIPPPANLRASPPPRSLVSLNTENTDTRSVSEIIESPPSRPYYAASPPPPPVLPTGTSTLIRSQPPPPTHMIRKEEEIIQQTVVTEDLPEPPVVISRRPEITSHVVDDVFLRTVTERRTIEDIERRRRRAAATNPEPPPPPPQKWDVVIRNYPDPNPPKNPPPPSSIASSSTLCWESDYTDAATSDYHGPPEDRTPEPREAPIWRDQAPLEEPVVSTKAPNWDVLIRVLQPPERTPSERAPSEATTTEYDTAPETDTEDRETESRRIEDDEEELAEMVRTTLTEADKEKWRQIITTESTLRTLLTEATVREDFERIRRDTRYRTLFEPHKWDVIIRVLAPPPSASQPSSSRGPRPPYRRSKSTEWDNRSRRSSLPTLYEYDSDTGASSVSTRRRGDDDERESRSRAPSSPARSRRGGRAPSSVYSDAPFSVSEVVVADHSRPEAMSDVMSDASGHTSASSSYFAPSSGKRGAIRKALPKGYRRRRFEDSEEDEEDAVDGSIARSASQPSLARSASEFTERWAVEGRSRESYAEFEDFFEDGSSSLRSGRSRASSGAIGLRRGGPSEGVGPGEDVVGSLRMTTTTTEVEKVRRVVRGADVWGGYGQE
ncbi:proteoglycan 4 [Ischnura elegans]|uniref:proteoglycan 4 n=1 Tax=Ischnura elegans TaxID=197161 RepID=UPI001ED8A79D|nr:proteoglycan 4 [Ischnura elegans]